MVKEKVKEKFDLDLALEIKVIGENGSKQGRR
jgi:UDP-N-acetylenolpyruvoylglucosamine reductase